MSLIKKMCLAQMILHFIIFKRDKQHSEAFSVLFSQVFMMYFVGFTQTNEVLILSIFEPLETLMN